MLNEAAVLEFTNGFNGVTSYRSDTILWIVFFVVLVILGSTVYFGSG